MAAGRLHTFSSLCRFQYVSSLPMLAAPSTNTRLRSYAAQQTSTTLRPQILDSSSGPQLLQQLDTLLFDQDGVLWRGQDIIPNAVEALHTFRAAGKRLLFVTNNSSKSRQEYVAKFKSLGIEVAAEEVG